MDSTPEDVSSQLCPAHNESTHHWVPVRVPWSKTQEQEMRCRFCKAQMPSLTK